MHTVTSNNICAHGFTGMWVRRSHHNNFCNIGMRTENTLYFSWENIEA